MTERPGIGSVTKGQKLTDQTGYSLQLPVTPHCNVHIPTDQKSRCVGIRPLTGSGSTPSSLTS